MNPLKEGATSRSKENIREIRHVYLDLDPRVHIYGAEQLRIRHMD